MRKLRGLAYSLAALLAIAGAGSAAAQEPAAGRHKLDPVRLGWGRLLLLCARFILPRTASSIWAATSTGCTRPLTGGKNWKIINNGIADYGVFSIAVDRKSPDTVYAATASGLCKSTDAGEHWKVLPDTLAGKSTATDRRKGQEYPLHCRGPPPTAAIVYAASPSGKVYKSTDGGETWKLSYAKQGRG